MVKKLDEILVDGMSEDISTESSIFNDNPSSLAGRKAALLEEAPELRESPETLLPLSTKAYEGVKPRTRSEPLSSSDEEVDSSEVPTIVKPTATNEVRIPKPEPPVSRAANYSYEPPINVLAVVSLILSILFAPAGIVTGHIALAQIRKSRDKGRGVALAGTIIGYIVTGFALLIMFLIFFAGSIFFSILGGFVALFS